MNQARLQLLIGRVFYDVAAAQTAPMVSLGRKHGLYAALADHRAGASDLARLRGLDQRFVQSWLINQAAAGYVSYDPQSETYSLDEEQRALFANPEGEWSMLGAFDFAVALSRGADGPSSPMPEILARLDPAKPLRVTRWLDHLRDRLTSGASVLEIGCGTGQVLMHLSALFPRSTFVGIDTSSEAIAIADAERTRRNGSASFHVGGDVPKQRFDVVLTVDTLHEVARADRLAQSVRDALRDGGAWIVSEMQVADEVAGNLNPVGRSVAAVDALYCFRESPTAAGALIGERRLRDLLAAAGFRDIRRIDDPQRLVLEARP